MTLSWNESVLRSVFVVPEMITRLRHIAGSDTGSKNKWGHVRSTASQCHCQTRACMIGSWDERQQGDENRCFSGN